MKMLLVMLLIISCEQNTKQNESKLNLKDTDQDGLIDINDKMPLVIEENLADITFYVEQERFSQMVKPKQSNLLWKNLVNKIGGDYHSVQSLELESNHFPLYALDIPSMFDENLAIKVSYEGDNENLSSITMGSSKSNASLSKNIEQIFYAQKTLSLFPTYKRKSDNFYKLLIVKEKMTKSFSVVAGTPLRIALAQIDEEFLNNIEQSYNDFKALGSNQFDASFLATFLFNTNEAGFNYQASKGEEIIVLSQSIGYFRDHFAETEKETITIEHDEINIDLPNISQVNLISRLDISIPKIKTRIVGCRFEIPFSGTAKLSIKEHFVEYQKLSNINDAFDLYLNDQKIGLAKLRATKFPRFQNNVLKLRKKFGDNKSMNIGFKDSNTKAKSFKKCSKDFVRNFSKGIYQQSYPVKWNGKIIAEKRVHI
ncbi:MAG: hypothetical protein VYA54_05545 [Bdellovibrionota bacterium]|nr:hypothetical protein [Bdellovibrionota bacterium]